MATAVEIQPHKYAKKQRDKNPHTYLLKSVTVVSGQKYAKTADSSPFTEKILTACRRSIKIIQSARHLINISYLNSKQQIPMRAIENVFSGTGGQIDLLNTLYGGSSMTTMNVEREDERLVITLSAPGVNANSFNVLVEGNKLVLYSLLVGTATRQDDDVLNPGGNSQRLAVPMFLRVLDIPNFVEADQIEAIHEESRVVVLLPLKNEDQLHRRIDIKDLF